MPGICEQIEPIRLPYLTAPGRSESHATPPEHIYKRREDLEAHPTHRLPHLEAPENLEASPTHPITTSKSPGGSGNVLCMLCVVVVCIECVVCSVSVCLCVCVYVCEIQVVELTFPK